MATTGVRTRLLARRIVAENGLGLGAAQRPVSLRRQRQCERLLLVALTWPFGSVQPTRGLLRGALLISADETQTVGLAAMVVLATWWLVWSS